MNRVAYLIPTIDRIGGAEQQVLHLATGLAKKGLGNKCHRPVRKRRRCGEDVAISGRIISHSLKKCEKASPIPAAGFGFIHGSSKTIRTSFTRICRMRHCLRDGRESPHLCG